MAAMRAARAASSISCNMDNWKVVAKDGRRYTGICPRTGWVDPRIWRRLIAAQKSRLWEIVQDHLYGTGTPDISGMPDEVQPLPKPSFPAASKEEKTGGQEEAAPEPSGGQEEAAASSDEKIGVPEETPKWGKLPAMVRCSGRVFG